MNLQIEERLGPALSRMISEMEGPGRVQISQAMGGEVRSLIVRHLEGLGQTRHTTAERLGGAQTGFIADLAQNFDQSSTVEVDEDGVSLSMRHPVISRAFRDITITARNGKYLTIPMNGLAYGRRVGEFSKFVLLRPKGEGSSARSDQPRKPLPTDVPCWLLVRSVTQPQDPTLFPSVDEIYGAAAEGARKEVREIISNAQSAS